MPEGLEPLVAAPPPVPVLGAEVVLSDPFPTPPALDELPVEPIPVELLPVLPLLVSLLLPVLVSLLPALVSLLLPVPPIVDDPLVAAPPPVLVLGAELVLSDPFPTPPTVDDGPVPVVEVPAEPVPMELGSLVVELEEPPLP